MHEALTFEEHEAEFYGRDRLVSGEGTMRPEEIEVRLKRYPSVMIMKPEYGGGWVVSGRDMEAFFAEIAKLLDDQVVQERLAWEEEKLAQITAVRPSKTMAEMQEAAGAGKRVW